MSVKFLFDAAEKGTGDQQKSLSKEVKKSSYNLWNVRRLIEKTVKKKKIWTTRPSEHPTQREKFQGGIIGCKDKKTSSTHLNGSTV